MAEMTLAPQMQAVAKSVVITFSTSEETDRNRRNNPTTNMAKATMKGDITESVFSKSCDASRQTPHHQSDHREL
jgi:hypothetical protein